VRIAIQDAAQQSYVAFARAPFLDFLGGNIGVTRLAASPAQTTIRFTLAAVQPTDIIVPAGTRVQTTDGKIAFATAIDLRIAAGLTTGDVVADAVTAGEIGNAYAIGDVTVILDPVASVASAANLDVTANGAAIEDDERLRLRIQQAPNQFSVAGSVDAYRFHALSVSAAIADVSVQNPTPGTVRIYVLGVDGLPSSELLGDVAAALSDQKVRPLTDTVEVDAPTSVDYAITATVVLLTGVDGDPMLDALTAAANAYVAGRAAGLGRDVVPSQVVAALSLPGVYSVALSAPSLTTIDDSEWAHCTGITITLGSPVEG
jgi:phage-related baseplate assembly protein